jgi:hypothetical protein
MKLYFGPIEINKDFLSNIRGILHEGDKPDKIIINISEIRPTVTRFDMDTKSGHTVKISKILAGMREIKRLYLTTDLLVALANDGKIILENKYKHVDVTEQIRKIKHGIKRR